jgi:hypothetical protein
VRDHRGEERVREHRGGGGGGGDIYYTSDDVYLDDSGSSGYFENPRAPSWTFEVGGLARRFKGPSFTRSGTVETTSGDMASYALASGSPQAGDTAAGMFDLRLTVPTSEHFYLGSELELGAITRSPIQMMTDSPDIHVSTRSLVGTAAVFGARARSRIAELDTELAGGLHFESLTVQSLDAGDEDPSETETAVTGFVEARVRGLLWVAPNVFLGAQAGVGVFDRSDVNVGLTLGFASHPYGTR